MKPFKKSYSHILKSYITSIAGVMRVWNLKERSSRLLAEQMERYFVSKTLLRQQMLQKVIVFLLWHIWYWHKLITCSKILKRSKQYQSFCGWETVFSYYLLLPLHYLISLTNSVQNFKNNNMIKWFHFSELDFPKHFFGIRFPINVVQLKCPLFVLFSQMQYIMFIE